MITITGTITGEYNYPMPPIPELNPRTNDEVKDYFIKMGYEVGWDFSKRTGQIWHEINLPQNGKTVVQIDVGVPLDAIRADLAYFADYPEATEGISTIDYVLSGGHRNGKSTKEFAFLCQAVKREVESNPVNPAFIKTSQNPHQI